MNYIPQEGHSTGTPTFKNRGVNLRNRMYHLKMTRDYDRALGFFQSAIEADPNYFPEYNDTALCFIRKEDMVEAGK